MPNERAEEIEKFLAEPKSLAKLGRHTPDESLVKTG
jgi:hypothetical protein